MDVRGVIFTDLDGTLLDHYTYDHSLALPALARISEEGIVVVFCSSKSLFEILRLQVRLGMEGPLISENGGGVFVKGMKGVEGYFPDTLHGYPAKVFGRPIMEVRGALKGISTKVSGKITGFGAMSVEEIAASTGLSSEEAAFAARRDFDEPFSWEPEPSTCEYDGAVKHLAEDGFTLTRGGRFFHLMGGCDKGIAVRWVRDNLFPMVPSLALGDSENDFPMLLAADRGVLVERPGGGYAPGAPEGVVKALGVGPAGWKSAVMEWLDEIL